MVGIPNNEKQTLLGQKVDKLGNLWPRLYASFIDDIIVGIPTVILFLIYFLLNPSLFSNILKILLEESPYENIKSWFQLIYFFFYILYGTFMLGKYGSTIGKKHQKLKVVTLDGKPIGYGRAFIRESFGKIISSLIFSLGFFWILIDKKRQGWHDKIAKTLVVETDKEGNTIKVSPEEAKVKPKWLLFLALFLLTGLPGLALGIFTTTYLFILQPHQVYGDAMAPTFTDKAYVITEKLSYRYRPPSRGDIIIFKYPKDEQYDYIKRIIGLPNEQITIREGKVYIDNLPLDEPYLTTGTYTSGGEFLSENQTISVPESYYFVLGDNRDQSSDSKEWGFVPRKNIIGRVTLCYLNCSK